MMRNLSDVFVGCYTMMQYVETPEFNPEAMHYQFVPADFDYMKNRHKHGVDTPTDFF
jgi:hypothetical protein